jgi:hypothetical protein
MREFCDSDIIDVYSNPFLQKVSSLYYSTKKSNTNQTHTLKGYMAFPDKDEFFVLFSRVVK